MRKNSKSGILTGALVGAALGVAAGMLLSPKSGRRLRSEIVTGSAEFYRFMAPRLKKFKGIGQKEYAAFVDKAIKAFVRGRSLSAKEATDLAKTAKASWRVMKRHLSTPRKR
ncbi:MAG: hypothetical protein A3B23_01195 [Candidatus Colwellbacteria bacterium RIFCSPLOWO2_01_FULL_48_10]|uniref:Gas vesicle protein n=1 Tax=Candidatus Colwellbacteria bacterium RIFCSPLOWO2_01_FULL_48_10 TaxID=1797690 RepID=A0A1G1Z4V6_9BACT|nr:MAG: hypothetical protein A3B23_01195 [Candidatus Colwellbacteria bacterium RIFCSPLOWO2_01_FULL_48_10]